MDLHAEIARRKRVQHLSGWATLLAGNVGSEDRLEYTVIGDTVNVASRLETMTKALGVPILLSASTADNLSEALTLHPMGDIEVRGKQTTLPVYGLASESSEAPPA